MVSVDSKLCAFTHALCLLAILLMQLFQLSSNKFQLFETDMVDKAGSSMLVSVICSLQREVCYCMIAWTIEIFSVDDWFFRLNCKH